MLAKARREARFGDAALALRLAFGATPARVAILEMLRKEPDAERRTSLYRGAVLGLVRHGGCPEPVTHGLAKAFLAAYLVASNRIER